MEYLSETLQKAKKSVVHINREINMRIIILDTLEIKQ